MTKDEYIFLIYATRRASSGTGLRYLSFNFKYPIFFCKCDATWPIWLRDEEITQKAQNYSAYSELLPAFSELLSVFRFTQCFPFHEGEPKGEPGTSHI